MKSVQKYILALLFLGFSTCKDREITNPFDAACPKEVFTPFEFKAEQQGAAVKLSWKQANTNITGFVINRNENDGAMTEVARIDKSFTQWSDENTAADKKYGYQLFAYAGENLSNKLTAYCTPVNKTVVTTDAVSGITSTSAVMGGSATNESGLAISGRGACYSTNVNPTTADNKVEMGSGSGAFSLSITGLKAGITYYARAYAITKQGTSYGSQVVFTTSYLNVSTASNTVPKENGSIVVNVASNIDWQVSSNQGWCTLNTNSGKGDGSVTVTFPENTGVPQRTVIITFTGAGVTSQTITLVQSGTEPPALSVSPDNQNVSNLAGSTTFSVTSNVSWTATSDQTWCTITNTSGTGNATLTVNYEANTTNSNRVVNLSINGTGLTAKTITVTQQSAISTEGLVAYYPFNGNANDESGNGNNGIVNGATLTTDRKGNANSAYLFNGKDNYIRVKDFGNKIPPQEITFSIWTNTILVQPNSIVIMDPDDGHNRFGVHLNYSYLGKIYWDFGNLFGSGRLNYNSPNATTNKWENWVFVSSYSNKCMKVYRNGILEESINTTTYFTQCASDLIIGGLSVGFFNGNLDDIRIYNRVLIETEIQQLYNE